MRWCRYHQRFAGILALLALGLQLVASFAHLHPDGARPPSDISLAGATSPSRLSTEGPNPPAGVPRDDCAICISVGLLGSGLTGQPPAILLPQPVRFAPRRPVSELKFSVARFYSFRTRAPPAA